MSTISTGAGRRVRLKAFVVSACAFAALLTCLHGFRSVSKSELTGTYVGENRVAREMLSLLPDGKYVQKVALADSSRVVVASGAWTYDAAEQRIDFEGFLVTTQDDLGQPMKAPGNLSCQVTRGWFGTSRIGSGEDERVTVYWKQGAQAGRDATHRGAENTKWGE